jgi:ATP-dependent helicase/DNAse subunit B
MVLFVLLSLMLQTSPDIDSSFNEKERAMYLQKHSFNDRMELFDEVVVRYRREFDAYGRQKDYSGFGPLLDKYNHLLKVTEQDLLQLPGEKKAKSRALRKLEIQLRKAKEDLQGFKSNAGADQLSAFENSIAQSESLRTKMLQIIFGKDFLKDK